jgi:hypothetical protein
LCRHSAAKRRRVDVVDEGALALDLDHRQPFAVPGFELRVAADVDLLELERDLRPRFLQDPAGTLAEVAALRVVQRDARGYG